MRERASTSASRSDTSWCLTSEHSADAQHSEKRVAGESMSSSSSPRSCVGSTFLGGSGSGGGGGGGGGSSSPAESRLLLRRRFGTSGSGEVGGDGSGDFGGLPAARRAAATSASFCACLSILRRMIWPRRRPCSLRAAASCSTSSKSTCINAISGFRLTHDMTPSAALRSAMACSVRASANWPPMLLPWRARSGRKARRRSSMLSIDDVTVTVRFALRSIATIPHKVPTIPRIRMSAFSAFSKARLSCSSVLPMA